MGRLLLDGFMQGHSYSYTLYQNYYYVSLSLSYIPVCEAVMPSFIDRANASSAQKCEPLHKGENDLGEAIFGENWFAGSDRHSARRAEWRSLPPPVT